jgi:hypothetical protein
MVLKERQLAGKNPKWTEVLGSVAAKVSLYHGRGKNNVSSYKAVFGHKFNHEFACSKEEARRCWTLDERMWVTKKKKFEEYVQEYFDVNPKGIIMASDADEDDDLSYFSSDKIPINKNDEVDDKYFDEHLMDNPEIAPTPMKAKGMKNKKSPLKKSPKDNSNSAPNAVYLTTSQNEHITVDEGKPPSAKANNDSDDSDDHKAVNIWDSSWVRDLTVDECQMINVPSTLSAYSIVEAWERINNLNREVKNKDVLSCCLYCDHCCHGGNLIVMVGNSSYKHRLWFSQDWYGTEFITGFAVMIQHAIHLSIPNYKNADRVMMVFCTYPKRQVTEILPYGDATHFVSVVFHEQHHALLYYNIANCSVTVFDGLNMDIQKWQDHVVHTVKTYGLQSPNASVDCEF